MSYRLEAAVAEGGRQSKGCYHRFLGLLNRVCSAGSNPAGRSALSTCSSAVDTLFPCVQGIMAHGNPNQIHGTQMANLYGNT